MSRLIVKNLPKEMKEQTLRDLFSQKGTVTDCSLKYTKSGMFRKFAFIGYSSDEEAKAAQSYFNNTFINISRIQVEFATDLCDGSKPRAWSKYSKDSSAFEKKHGAKTESSNEKEKQKTEIKKKKKDERIEALLGDLKDDPEFQEFLHVHQNIAKKQTWTDGYADSKQRQEEDGHVREDNSDDESDDSDQKNLKEEDGADKDEKMEPDSCRVKESTQEKNKKMSDLEYMKSKMAELSDESGAEGEKEDTTKVKKKQKADKLQNVEKEEKYVLKVKNLPASVKEKTIREFFQPLTGLKVRIPRNKNKNSIGIAFVEFSQEKDLESAMGKNRNFIGGKKIFLKRTTEDVPDDDIKERPPRPWELKKEDAGEMESIAESGKLFVRNLAYVCTQEALEKLFSKYGPITEVDLPIDSLTKKIKGFAHVTYMLPEHAVKAFAELDGTAFMGRMLHILPGISAQERYQSSEQSSYKKKKDQEIKAMAKSSHNWNTLFLGADAVASAMAKKYDKEKREILDDTTGKGELALSVRMALGESQLVVETRNFLIDNGVVLDSFSQAAGERSKTVILAKNLPAGTKAEELTEIFSKFGSLGRVILPPSGITAIIEYVEPYEAKQGFTKLAYTKFHHLPLYLEWAPTNIFAKNLEKSSADQGGEVDTKEETLEEKKADVGKSKPVDSGVDSGEEEEEEAEPGANLFVKNLNFNTEESSVKELFSQCGDVLRVTIAKKKDMKNPGKLLSMGYGFVEFKQKACAEEALKVLQHCQLDGHQLELKLSNREALHPKVPGKKKAKEKKQTSSKILVRNIPFQAKRKEVEDLFKVFGELKYVRLPKKLSGTGSHRGFAFVDFLTKQDAKRAFDTLCHSTHLYGRRLVLEWAETAETVEDLRRKTSLHFHGGGPSKKLKKSALLDSLE